MIQGYNRNRFIVKEKYGFPKMLTQENLARGSFSFACENFDLPQIV